MKIEKIAKVAAGVSPLELALDWDNVGFLVGDVNKDVKKILVAIDVTEAVVAEAVKGKCDLILSYHPVIWDGLKSVTSDGPGRIVYELIRAGIGVYSIHTAYDMAIGGTNDQLAEIIGIKDGEAIGEFVAGPGGKLYKLVTFVPSEDVEDVAEAIFAAGAGNIGNYSHCSYRGAGVGTFLPGDGARPAIGKKGSLEKVDEVRLEAMVPESKAAGVIKALRAAHRYEEPAFDMFRHVDVEKKYGLGRIGELDEPMTLGEVVERVKKVTGAEAVGLVGPGRMSRKIRRGAVCAGSCGSIINKIIARGCDVYITGELKHHLALAASEAGLDCICLSHTVSERFALKKLVNGLKKELDGVTIGLSKKDADPFEWKNV